MNKREWKRFERDSALALAAIDRTGVTVTRCNPGKAHGSMTLQRNVPGRLTGGDGTRLQFPTVLGCMSKSLAWQVVTTQNN